MILKQSHSTLYVFDQERAKAFYTEKLGFEVREDATLGAFRWLTVAPKTQADHCMILMASPRARSWIRPPSTRSASS
jgi:catechol 2,3-dioxygenase-like lactoylglutathione lyase family enzyme